jgi:hypothetical protein
MGALMIAKIAPSAVRAVSVQTRHLLRQQAQRPAKNLAVKQARKQAQ